MSSRDILVIGDAFCDVNAGPLPKLPQWGVNVVSPQPICAMPGGAALNVASWLQRLRGGVTLYTGIGHDAFGDMLRQHCTKFGLRLIEAPSDARQPTGVCMVLAGPDDRAFCSHFGISDTFDASALLADDARALRKLGICHVHVSGFFSCAALRKTLPALLRAARELGATTSLDTNNDASGRWGAVDGLWDDILPLITLFMPNELEACAIAGVAAGEVESALAKLRTQVGGQHGGHVVVTRGARGALVSSSGGSSSGSCSAAPTPTVVHSPAVAALDAVGAGDAFKAGLLACLLDGVSLVESAQLGCLTGAMCVTMRGACTDPPSVKHVVAFAAAHGFEAAAAGLKREGAPCEGAEDTNGRGVGSGGGSVGSGSVGRGSSGGASSGGSSSDHFNAGKARAAGEEASPLTVWAGFALLWLGGTWPYQATLQAQAYYAHELPDLSFLVLITFTWPLLGCHLLQACGSGAGPRVHAAPSATLLCTHARAHTRAFAHTHARTHARTCTHTHTARAHTRAMVRAGAQRGSQGGRLHATRPRLFWCQRLRRRGLLAARRSAALCRRPVRLALSKRPLQ